MAFNFRAVLPLTLVSFSKAIPLSQASAGALAEQLRELLGEKGELKEA